MDVLVYPLADGYRCTYGLHSWGKIEVKQRNNSCVACYQGYDPEQTRSHHLVVEEKEYNLQGKKPREESLDLLLTILRGILEEPSFVFAQKDAKPVRGGTEIIIVS